MQSQGPGRQRSTHGKNPEVWRLLPLNESVGSMGGRLIEQREGEVGS